MRRRSIVGQAVLIVAGAILLLHNFYPELNFFPALAEYWPLLLAAAGVLQLAALLARGDWGSAGSAVRLSVLMIAVGVLFSIDHETRYSIAQTWPALLIVLGILNFGPRGGSYRRCSRAAGIGGNR